MDFQLWRIEPDIWFYRVDNTSLHYKYTSVYTNSLLIALKTPQNIADALVNKYNFKLKDTGLISYHLDCDFI